ncbi:hypothetical protein BT69DRAFT_146564 [Atractiella rhizophila]|nr:hypothetical protein BT69DRAFT_146564 [Atractiella rhizophila]
MSNTLHEKSPNLPFAQSKRTASRETRCDLSHGSRQLVICPDKPGPDAALHGHCLAKP